MSQLAKVEPFLASESNRMQPVRRALTKMQEAKRAGSNRQSVNSASEKSADRTIGTANRQRWKRLPEKSRSSSDKSGEKRTPSKARADSSS